LDSNTAARAIVHFGALTFAAESGSVRRLSRATISSNATGTSRHEAVIGFGGSPSQIDGDMGFVNPTRRHVGDMGPCVCGPGHNIVLNTWHGSGVAAAIWEFELAWVEF